MIGNVLNLFINKVEKKQICVDEQGILDDKHYAKEIDRSILIISTRSYHIASKNNISLDYGELSENIHIDCNIYNLKAGSKLKIGETILQISQHCTLCKSLTKIDNKLPKLLKTDRGVFAKVLQSGTLSQNDKVEFL